MGYTTDFDGEFKITPPLSQKHVAYLTKFAQTRRMARDVQKTARRPDPFREAASLPVGPQGAYFVNESGMSGQDNGPDVTNSNGPPTGQPGLWCQWTPSEDGATLGWDGGEKFYNYVEWLEYLIAHFLKPWGYQLNGTVTWSGEESSDHGQIVVKNNTVTPVVGKIVYGQATGDDSDEGAPDEALTLLEAALALTEQFRSP